MNERRKIIGIGSETLIFATVTGDSTISGYQIDIGRFGWYTVKL